MKPSRARATTRRPFAEHAGVPGPSRTIQGPKRDTLRAAFLAILLALSAAPGGAIPDGYSTTPFRAGEVLRFRARWKFFHLGTLRFEQHAAPGQIDDSSAFEVRMIVDSSPGLPFANVHFMNQAIIASSDPANRAFVYESSGDSPARIAYSSDPSRETVHIEMARGGRLEYEGDMSVPGGAYDAGGLFMVLRCLAASGLRVSVPTIVDRDIHGTRVRFTNEIRTIHVPAFPHGVRARHIVVDADWASQTCAGLTGRFHGWVTDDADAIPLKVAVEIALGSVVLELDSLDRPQEAARAE